LIFNLARLPRLREHQYPFLIIPPRAVNDLFPNYPCLLLSACGNLGIFAGVDDEK
jgi:hypothetical protein